MDDSTRRTAEQDDIDEQEWIHRFYERLSDWSEPDVVKINRNGKLLDPVAELRKWKPMISWNRLNR